MPGIKKFIGTGLTRQGAMLKQVIASIFGVGITPVTSSSFDITATVDTLDNDATVTVEYGLTTDYGDEIPTNEGTINGIVPITAVLTL